MSVPWFRTYENEVNDHRLQSLPGEDFKVYHNLLCLTSMYGGSLPPREGLPFLLRLSPKETEKRIRTLIDAGLIVQDGDALKPHDWGGRQFKSDGSAERMRRHRVKANDVTGDGDVTSQVTPKDKPHVPSGDGDACHPIVTCDRRETELEIDTDSSSSTEPGSALSDGDLLAALRKAADDHVMPGCADVQPIRKLIANGCDLAADILPTVRAAIPTLRKPLRTWNAEWLLTSALAAAKARKAHGAVAGQGEMIFVAREAPEWAACAARFKRERQKSGPPSRVNGLAGWMFPACWPETKAIGTSPATAHVGQT